MGYRLVATTCKDGDCPSILVDDSNGSVIVRGPENRRSRWFRRSRERDICYTAEEWRTLMAQAASAGL